MRKIAIILTFLLTMFLSSVSFASCNLDPHRWEWVESGNMYVTYLDKASIKESAYIAQAGGCHYFPKGCNWNHRGYKSEHYHFFVYYINYNFNSICVKSSAIMDAYGNLIQSITFDDDELQFEPIMQDNEKFARAVLKILRS